MSDFQDIINQDNDIFFNVDEFGESADINEVPILIVQDNDKLQYRKNKDTSGLITGDVLFYITEAEFEKIPKVKYPPRTGDALLYKGKPATITGVTIDYGLVEIILQFTGAW